MAACQLSMEYGLTGPVITQIAACATSIICFQDALRMIQRGEVDVVLAGGIGGAAAADGLRRAGQHARAVASATTTPSTRRGRSTRTATASSSARAPASWSSSRPSTPSTRGATIHAELIGAALTADAFHISAPEPTGRGACMAMTKAMADAGVAPDEIDYIVAHGTSTPLNDVTETRAIKARLRRRTRTSVAIIVAQVDGRPH